MTGTYEWNPMPHVVEIRCPKCSSLATFEFAEVVKIHKKIDVPFFQKHKLFEYQLFSDRIGNRWHAAIFYPGLHVRDTTALKSLPEGYERTDWNHSRYLYRNHGLDVGTAICDGCGHRQKHKLDWPTESFFQVEYRKARLWAFHRESAVALRKFIASDDRDPKKFKWCSFLLHVPTHFLHHKARATILKRLDRLLSP